MLALLHRYVAAILKIRPGCSVVIASQDAKLIDER